jgi:hypothetical protein
MWLRKDMQNRVLQQFKQKPATIIRTKLSYQTHKIPNCYRQLDGRAITENLEDEGDEP